MDDYGPLLPFLYLDKNNEKKKNEIYEMWDVWSKSDNCV